ncbi:pentapeptide repeat-containing protein [Micromonospora sp. NPDC023814]|uniref:pentapeptide repeat-containing protein n=1 Tax=Micromonospora sp. NPDC023814 TaxID=3154596 RepID=UPI0033D2C0FD
MTIRASKALLIVGAVLVVLAILTPIPAEWWLRTLPRLADFWLAVAIAALGIAALVFGMRLNRRTKPGLAPSAAPLPPDRQLRPIRSWVFPAGALVVVVATWTATLWLQSAVPKEADPQKAQLRINAIRTGLSVGAGVAGALALLLALRRQQLAERSQQATEYDAGEKRVTELYVKAAEQLGSEKAPVRLAGLYALERLAQDNPMHRQSITEVICAYLRMPLPPAPNTDQPSDNVTEHVQQTERWAGERQVRLAAQRILVRHAKDDEQAVSSGIFWGSLSFDLAEATLIDADFSRTQLGTFSCNGAKFVGKANFLGATFNSCPDFRAAHFAGEANFAGARFASGAEFGRSHFGDSVRFTRAKFEEEATFSFAAFGGTTLFDYSSFAADANLDHCVFQANLRFLRAEFGKDAWFDGSRFCDRLGFDRSTFGGDVSFDDARFEGQAFFRVLEIAGEFDFTGATVSEEKEVRASVWPKGWKKSETGKGLEKESNFKIEVE